MDFAGIPDKEEYAFLKTHPRLGKRIILLGVSGSHGYGTQRQGSDIDLRGIAFNSRSDLLGLTSFDQYEDCQTDTVIYSFMKAVRLFLDCNPNMIEMLGLDDDRYLCMNEAGRLLRDSRHLFLSKRAVASFGHYAQAQLRRLQNAIARDTLPQTERTKHILNSLNNALENFNRFHQDENGTMRLYIDQSQREDMETEIFLDGTFAHYPLKQFNELNNTLCGVARDYDRIGHRNHKKDDAHLNKHAMHLVRLFMMGIDILEKEEIITRRSGDDLALLRKIRDGYYMHDSMLDEEFYAMVKDYEERFKKAERRTALPDHPDLNAIEVLVEKINEMALEDV